MKRNSKWPIRIAAEEEAAAKFIRREAASIRRRAALILASMDRQLVGRTLEDIRGLLSILNPGSPMFQAYSLAETLAEGWLQSLELVDLLQSKALPLGRPSHLRRWLRERSYPEAYLPLLDILVKQSRKRPGRPLAVNMPPTAYVFQLMEEQRAALKKDGLPVTDKSALERLFAGVPVGHRSATVRKWTKKISEYRRLEDIPLRPRKFRKPPRK